MGSGRASAQKSGHFFRLVLVLNCFEHGLSMGLVLVLYWFSVDLVLVLEHPVIRLGSPLKRLGKTILIERVHLVLGERINFLKLVAWITSLSKGWPTPHRRQEVHSMRGFALIQNWISFGHHTKPPVRTRQKHAKCTHKWMVSVSAQERPP